MSPGDLQHELGKRAPFDSPAQEAFLNLVRTASVLAADFQRLFKSRRLSESTYNALRILRGALHDPKGTGARSCSQIGAHLVARVPDVTRLVDRLERLGYAQRVRCKEDRRVVYVRVTRRGLDLLAKLDKPVMALHRAQLEHMKQAELRQLSHLLSKARSPEPPGRKGSP